MAILTPWETGAQAGQDGLRRKAGADAYGEAHSDVDPALDSATWGQWAAMSDEDRAAMIMAESLIRGNGRRGVASSRPAGGWAELSGAPE